MRLSAAAVSVLLISVLACHDSTGPEAPFTVSVSIESTTGPTFFNDDTVPRIQCFVTLRAVARGPGSAIWGDGKVYVFAGPDRVTPIDSSVISAQTIRESWGASSIDSSEVRHAQWQLSAGIPFGLSFVFTYSKNGEVQQAGPVAFTCGPTIPSGTGPPQFGQVSVSPAAGEIEGGDTLTVSYAVSSPVGLWETEIDLTGACSLSRHLGEQLVITTARIVPIVVPPECSIGGTLSVAVRAFDAAGQGVQSQIATLSVVDRTPPRVSASLGFDGQVKLIYFGGDTIPAYLHASDNHALSVVYREVLPWGRRDSLLTTAPTLNARLDIPIPEDWAGGIQVRAFSRDGAGLVSDTIVTPADSLRIFPTVARAVQSRIMGGVIRDLIFDERRGAIYLLNSSPSYVAVLSATDLTLVDSIPLPGAASDFDITVSGDTLVVVLVDLHALGILDLNASPRTVVVHPLTTLNAAMDQRPELVRIPANGKIFVRLNGATFPQTTLLEVDLSSGVERVRSDAGNNGVVGYVTMERSNDRGVMVLWQGQQLQRYDASGDVFGPLTAAASYASRFSLDATGSRLALGLDVFDAATLQFERHVESPAWDPYLAVALSPDGQVLYHYSLPQGVLRADASTGHLLERARTPAVTFMRVSPDGTRLALLNWKTFSLMDLR